MNINYILHYKYYISVKFSEHDNCIVYVRERPSSQKINNGLFRREPSIHLELNPNQMIQEGWRKGGRKGWRKGEGCVHVEREGRETE